MSIKLMSAIFEAEFRDLEYPKDGQIRKAKASTAKLVLLAIADHANDEGEAYPGFTRLETKTALSRQGVSDTLDALRYNGLLSVDDKPSKLHTNVYTINLRALPAIARELPDIIKPLDYQESSHLTSASQVALLDVVKPLDLNHHLTVNQPSNNRAEKTIEQQADQKIDTILSMVGMPGLKKEQRILQYETLVKVKTGIEPTRRKWGDLWDFVDKQSGQARDLETFLSWLTAQPRFDASYWPPEKMRENWNRAFMPQPAQGRHPAQRIPAGV